MLPLFNIPFNKTQEPISSHSRFFFFFMEKEAKIAIQSEKVPA